MFVNVSILCATCTHRQMYGRYTQLSKFAKQFAASQRESARQGRQRKTLDIKEAKRRKSRTWSELRDALLTVRVLVGWPELFHVMTSVT